MEKEAMISEETMNKLEKLKSCFQKAGKAAVAFSGGVDSTFLLKTAQEVLGSRVTAITASSQAVPERELKEAAEFCSKEHIRQIIFPAWELQAKSFLSNAPDRCYFCKKAIFGKILEIAREEDIPFIAEGSNVDDDGDYRPGQKAVAELKIASPLKECGLTKAEIRQLSRYLGLPSWNKPSCACLASRFVYGEPVTPEKMAMADHAEQFLLELGFSQIRVRVHGGLARIEILPEEFPALLAHREVIAGRLKEYGFSYITMDLQGYRTGSMNETL